MVSHLAKYPTCMTHLFRPGYICFDRTLIIPDMLKMYFDKQNMVYCESNIFTTSPCASLHHSQIEMMGASWIYGHMTTNVHSSLDKGEGGLNLPTGSSYPTLPYRIKGKCSGIAPTSQRVWDAETLIHINVSHRGVFAVSLSLLRLSLLSMDTCSISVRHTGIPPHCADRRAPFWGCGVNLWYESREEVAAQAPQLVAPPHSAIREATLREIEFGVVIWRMQNGWYSRCERKKEDKQQRRGRREDRGREWKSGLEINHRWVCYRQIKNTSVEIEAEDGKCAAQPHWHDGECAAD